MKTLYMTMFVTAVQLVQAQQLPRVFYRHYSDGGQRRLELRVADGGTYTVTGAFAGRGACGFVFVGASQNKYRRVINLSNQEELVLCGVSQDGNNPNIYSVRVFTQQHQSVLLGNDAVATVVFNFNDPSGLQFRVSSDVVTVGGDPTNVISPEAIGGEAVRLAILDDVGNEITGRSVSLSDSIRTRIVLQITNPVSGAVGVRGLNMYGRPAFGSSQGSLLIDGDGCGTSTDATGNFIPQSEGFIGSQPAGNEFWATSPPFKVFYFISTGQPTLVLEAELEYCVSSNSTRCLSNQCLRVGRRRREATDEGRLIARSLVVIELEPQTSALSERCQTSTIYIVTTCVLAFVLFVALCFSVFFAIRAMGATPKSHSRGLSYVSRKPSVISQPLSAAGSM